MIAMTVAQRRDLETERQSRETEEQKQAREVSDPYGETAHRLTRAVS